MDFITTKNIRPKAVYRIIIWWMPGKKSRTITLSGDNTPDGFSRLQDLIEHCPSLAKGNSMALEALRSGNHRKAQEILETTQELLN